MSTSDKSAGAQPGFAMEAARFITLATPKTQSFHEKGAAYVAEFVGTFILVLTVGCCLMTAAHSIWNGMAIASALTVAIYSMGPISGGHLNPAVSLAIFLKPRSKEDDVPVDDFPLQQLLCYIAAQLLGGLAAGGCFTTLFNRSASLNPGPSYGYWEVGMVETVFTAMLAFVVLNVACETKRVNQDGDGNQFFALAIGFVVVVGAYAGGPVSGAVFNPAVAIGIEATSEYGKWSTFFIYAFFQMLGGVIAAVLYRLVRPDISLEEDYKLKTKMASQFIGTWIITFTAGLAVLTASASGSTHVWPLAVAACTMCMLYAMKDICHGCFNPSITLAFLLGGRNYMPVREGLAIVCMQFFAGLLASFVYAGIGKGCWTNTYHTFPVEPSTIPYHWGQNCAGEIAFTALTAFAAMAVSSTTVYQSVTPHFYKAEPPKDHMRTMWQTGLAIGLSTLIGGVAMDLQGSNGGMLNPAVTLAAATSSSILNNSCWACCLKYIVYELAGGVVAALFFRVLYAREYN